MKASKGKANPGILNKILLEKLNAKSWEQYRWAFLGSFVSKSTSSHIHSLLFLGPYITWKGTPWQGFVQSISMKQILLNKCRVLIFFLSLGCLNSCIHMGGEKSNKKVCMLLGEYKATSSLQQYKETCARSSFNKLKIFLYMAYISIATSVSVQCCLTYLKMLKLLLLLSNIVQVFRECLRFYPV